MGCGAVSVDGDVYLTVLRRSDLRTGTSTTPVLMGYGTVSGETPYMDVFTVGKVLSVGIWWDGEAGMLAGGYESEPARNGCLVVVLISVGCLVAARLCQELLDDVGDEALMSSPICSKRFMMILVFSFQFVAHTLFLTYLLPFKLISSAVFTLYSKIIVTL